jgi:hypothetical protein
VTLPLPLPLDPEVIAIQLAAQLAVQEHPAVVVVVTEPVEGFAPTDAEPGEIAYEQVEDAPDWVTVNVRPPIVRVPVRDVAPVFAPTE